MGLAEDIQAARERQLAMQTALQDEAAALEKKRVEESETDNLAEGTAS